MRCQQFDKTRTGLRQIIHPSALGGRANLQILSQAIWLVADQLRDPDQSPKGLEGHQVDLIRVYPMAVRHQQMQIITDAKHLEVTEQAGLLGFTQTGAGDRLEQRWWRGMPNLATGIGLDVGQRLATSMRVGLLHQRVVLTLLCRRNDLEQPTQTLRTAPRPPLRLFSGHVGLKLPVLHHALNGLARFVLEQGRLHTVLRKQVDHVVLGRDTSVVVRLIRIGDDLRRALFIRTVAYLRHGHRHHADMIATTLSTHGEMKISPQVKVRFTHGWQTALEAHNRHWVLHHRRSQRFNRHQGNRLVACRLQFFTIRDEAALHCINPTHHPFHRVGNEGQQLSPVPDLVTAQLQRFL